MKTVVRMLPDEHWWGGTTMNADCPISHSSSYHEDMRKSCENQTMSFFLSDKGRYIWSDDPFRIDIEDGVIRIEGGSCSLEQVGSTLREAYLAASETHFPLEDKEPLPEVFSVGGYPSARIRFRKSRPPAHTENGPSAIFFQNRSGRFLRIYTGGSCHESRRSQICGSG